MKSSVIFISILSVIPGCSFASVLRVPSEYATIQAGIDAAFNGDTVLVSDGTYSGDGNWDIDFKGKAIVVMTENGANRCVIDCQDTETEHHRGFYFHYGEDETSIVKGFTIQNGEKELGGGIYCAYSSPTIAECTFTENLATGNFAKGGGIYCTDASPTIIACTFTENKVDSLFATGGGIYCANSSPKIADCTFTANTGHAGFVFNGGGICLNNSSPEIMNCIFRENHADGFLNGCGGGIVSFNSLANITNCMFTGNTSDYGGGIYCSESTLTLTNCLMYGNTATNYGGGVYCSTESETISNLHFINCTIVGNTGSHQHGGIGIGHSSMSMKNSIVWDNFPKQFDDTKHHSISFSNIQGGYSGVGNINSDPLFQGSGTLDFHLSRTSPCIDTGTDNGVTDVDLEGSPRMSGGTTDMGAYEFQDWPLITRSYVKMPSHEFRPGDTASCVGSVWNPHEYVYDEYKFFAVLEVCGNYYCAPSFNNFDYFLQDCQPGLTEIPIIPTFTWPSNVGSASGVMWYSFLMNPELSMLESEVGIFDFGWSE